MLKCNSEGRTLRRGMRSIQAPTDRTIWHLDRATLVLVNPFELSKNPLSLTADGHDAKE
jgi:hypothetical protein